MKTWNAFIKKKIPLPYQDEDKEKHLASEYVLILLHSYALLTR